MSSARRRAQWAALCRTAEELVRFIRSHGETLLLESSAEQGYSGYPSSASGAGVGRGGSTDPLGERIASLVDWDATRAAVVRAMWDDLDNAIVLLRDVERRGSEAVPRPHIERAPSKPEAPGCVNCERHEIYAVAVRAGRCWACYRYRLGHAGTDAPRRLIVIRAENATRRQLAQLAADGELPDSAAS